MVVFDDAMLEKNGRPIRLVVVGLDQDQSLVEAVRYKGFNFVNYIDIIVNVVFVNNCGYLTKYTPPFTVPEIYLFQQ